MCNVIASSPVLVPKAGGSGSSSPVNPTHRWNSKSLRHTSALVMLPPKSVWPAIQDIRCVRDKSYLRWMPHVNVLYPFLEDDEEGTNFAEAAKVASGALTDIHPFQCALNDFKFFKHRNSTTVWLRPSEVVGESIKSIAKVDSTGDNITGEEKEIPMCSNLITSQKKLEAAFPLANDLSQISIDGFTPHISVGQWPDAVTAAAACANLHSTWKGLEFEVDAFYLISRSKNGDDAFRVKAKIPLSGGDVEFLTDDGVDECVTEYSVDDTRDTCWWREPYAPHTPPLGARCLVPRTKRGQRRGRGKGGRSGQTGEKE